MLRWLTSHRYSIFDAVWLGMVPLAINDEAYLAAVVIVFGGILASVTLEKFAKRKTP